MVTASDYIPSVKEKEFVKYHESLRGEINNANWHFEIWKYLQNLRKGYLKELNQAPAFFGLTIRAHLLETVMRLNKFLDRGGDIISIYEFFDFVEQNLDIFSNQAFEKRVRGKAAYDRVLRDHIEITCEIVGQHRQKLENLPINNLRKWRNKALAHIDKKHVLENIDVIKRYPVKVEQIDEIINTLHEMLNDYCIAYDASAWDKDLSFHHGIQTIVDAIRFEIQERKKRWGLEETKENEG